MVGEDGDDDDDARCVSENISPRIQAPCGREPYRIRVWMLVRQKSRTT